MNRAGFSERLRFAIVSNVFPMPTYVKCACGWECHGAFGSGHQIPPLERGAAIDRGARRHEQRCRLNTGTGSMR